jgi:hypothetical protein
MIVALMLVCAIVWAGRDLKHNFCETISEEMNEWF